MTVSELLLTLGERAEEKRAVSGVSGEFTTLFVAVKIKLSAV